MSVPRPAPYSARERQALASIVRAEPPHACPACGGVLTVTPVDPEARLPYVRRRLWLLCAGCRRTATIDAPA